MKRLFAVSLLASYLIAPSAQSSECLLHFNFVDVHAQKAFMVDKVPDWQAHDQMCERLESFDGAINVAGGFSAGAGTVSYFVQLTVGDRVTGLGIPDHEIKSVMSGRFPDAQTQSELLEIAIPAFRSTTIELLQRWYTSGKFEKAVKAFLTSRTMLMQR